MVFNDIILLDYVEYVTYLTGCSTFFKIFPEEVRELERLLVSPVKSTQEPQKYSMSLPLKTRVMTVMLVYEPFLRRVRVACCPVFTFSNLLGAVIFSEGC